MRIRYLVTLAALAVTAHASEEPVNTEKAIDALVAKLGSEDKAVRADAQKKLRAQRRTALRELVGHLERTTDADRKKQLLAILEPSTLKPLGNAKLLETIGLARAMTPVLDDYLGDDEKARAAADKRLGGAQPYAALVVQSRMDAEKDAGKRVRLRVLYYRILDDTWERADAMFKAAQGLHTVARNLGPFKDKWDSAAIVKLRSRAKVLHWCFVDPAYYEKAIERNIGMYVPYRDLPAARDLYKLARKMYENLAKLEQDEVKAATLKANAAAAAKAADECDQAAPRTKG